MSSTKLTKLFFGLALSISALTSTQASADATLDRIKGRGKLTVGVILSGAPFGYIDPKTQAQKGYNLDTRFLLLVAHETYGRGTQISQFG
ncbi:Hypothetical protein NGAL_HAMBI2427_60350 [Neorhizobium galegae bv. orientalis]|uniref:Amino acid ABC transporter substrate-binding protein n=1 Tax=Neorhizobium galegae bv. orientalis str. HAMBI 540 TaxID=1028800 RepID=A0A068T439_NEOGA|nr:Hypothetical protein RG540_PA14890 [Neorhizobium galegae bv. orientalis str. HAMBI 540]CDZ55142.1 Hypothetical protein NGAL_HAMBI2427_60350 [Neorhizobium galegae bv. orientalis]